MRSFRSAPGTKQTLQDGRLRFVVRRSDNPHDDQSLADLWRQQIEIDGAAYTVADIGFYGGLGEGEPNEVVLTVTEA